MRALLVSKFANFFATSLDSRALPLKCRPARHPEGAQVYRLLAAAWAGGAGQQTGRGKHAGPRHVYC